MYRQKRDAYKKRKEKISGYMQHNLFLIVNKLKLEYKNRERLLFSTTDLESSIMVDFATLPNNTHPNI